MIFEPFYLPNEPFSQPATVFAVFRAADGECCVSYAQALEHVAENFAAQFSDASCLGQSAVEFAEKSALEYFEDISLTLSDDSGRIIADRCYAPDLNRYAVLCACKPVLLCGNEQFSCDLLDIKAGVNAGHAAYGIIEVGEVVCAAYTLLPVAEEDECEIGVETVSAYAGKGFASGCVSALAKYLTSLNKTVLYSHYSDHKASAAIADKCGFVKISEGFEVIIEKREDNAF